MVSPTSHTPSFSVYLERPYLAPGVDPAVESEESERPGLESEEQHAVVHHSLRPTLASLAPLASPHHHRLSEVQAEVEETARDLLLVREAELDRGEGDVEALDESLLTDRQEYRAVRVTEELLGDKPSPDLVIYPVLHLSREAELQHNTSLTVISHLVECDDSAVNGCQEDVV